MKKSPGIKKWFKKRSKEKYFENYNCRNCNTQFSGKFCPECGQSVNDYDKPFSFIFFNFVGDFFAFDARFYRTFSTLLFKPGKITKEYFDGRRIKYAPPFRIFIFVSFILFLLLQIYTNKGLTKVLDSSLKDGAFINLDSMSLAMADSVYTKITTEMDSTQSSVTDSIVNTLGITTDTSNPENLNFKVNLETFRDTRDLRQGLNKYAKVLEERLSNETDEKKKAKLREYIRLCRSPEQAMAKILEYMSWAFFLLLPLFALILKLFYIRRKHNYMKHLVFSIHIHSFLFVLFIIVVGLYLIFKGNLETITTLIVLLYPVYFVLALKKFYGQSIQKVILKFLGISFLYNIIFFFVVIFVFVNALSII